MIAESPTSVSAISEGEVRRQINRSLCRALVDHEFALLLLTDPTVALEDQGCPPQQYRSLRSIRATDLIDFARQAQALFWIREPSSTRREAQLPLAAAAL
jgi:hypothetical protein